MRMRLRAMVVLLVALTAMCTEAPTGAQGLVGTLLVSRPIGLVLVQPVSGDTALLLTPAAGAVPQGVAWSEAFSSIAVSVRVRQASEGIGGADILVLDRNGAELSRIARDQLDIALRSPAWLPSGEIVYERVDLAVSSEPSRIEASQPDGSARHILVPDGRLPGPSPGGLRLAYVAPGQPFDRLMLLDLATGESNPLVQNSMEGYVYFSRPRFSPDGQLVAFGAAGGPNLPERRLPAGFGSRLFATPRGHGPGWDVWAIGADATGLRQITSFNYEDDLAVAWSPDGQWLAGFGPNALYLIPVAQSGPATPIGRGGLGEPDWAATELLPPSSSP